ncbi:UNVERIFIED_CONTAM: protein kinase rio1, partial [Siphonaria sp. JEL0065]
MVKMWAEKEMRNLKRLVVAGIPCPEPLLLRMHVLVMGFLGDKNGWASPRLKDAVINDSMIYKNLYIHLLKMVWKMYHKCKLVHADLSEYNLLYHNKTLFLIDVSQSVEHDHPHALEFLRKDLQNICDYFQKRVPPPSEEYPDSVNIFTLRELFDFTVTPWDAILKTVRDKGLLDLGDGVSEVDEDAVLDAYTMHMHSPEARLNIQEVAASKGVSVAAAQAEVDIQEAVFKQAYIPRTLQEIVDFERDVDKAQKGQVEVNSGVGVYGRVTGLIIEERIGAGGVSKDAVAAAVAVSGSTAAAAGGKKNSSSSAATATPTATAKDGPFSEENDEESEEDDDDSEDDSEDGEDGEGSDFDDDRKKESRLKKDEEKDSKKARKQAVKDEKREKRKAKMPKAVKKRKQKVSAASK